MLGFLFGGIGKIVMTLGVGAVVLAAAFYSGYVKGDAQCATKAQLAEATAALMAKEHELAALNTVLEYQSELGAKHVERIKGYDKSVRELEKLIDSRIDNCTATPDELRGLQNIR